MSEMFSKSKRSFLPYMLILPALFLILLFKIFPIISTLLESVHVNDKWTLSVYGGLLKDPTFWNSIWITIKVNIVMIPFQIFIAFLLSLLANVTVKGIGVYRTIFYLPITLSLPIATVLWNIMLSPNNGVINSVLGLFGVPHQGFLVDKNQALWCIVLIASYKGCAYWMMFLLAGLKNIDTSIYESVRIDGAGWLTTVTKITLPLIKNVLLFVFVANTTANVLLFVPMQLVTGGGPQGSTNVLMYEAYKSAFKFSDRPRSAAMVTVLLILIVIVCIFQFRLLNEKKDDMAIK